MPAIFEENFIYDVHGVKATLHKPNRLPIIVFARFFATLLGTIVHVHKISGTKVIRNEKR